MNDLESWCDETLPELYDEGMFDCEEISEEVWDAVATAMEPLVDEDDELSTSLMAAAAEWFRGHHDILLGLLQPTSVAPLCNRPQIVQHTAEWYAQRRHCLTASEFAHILDGRRGSLLRQKISSEPNTRSGFPPIGIAQPDGEMNATTWGHRFESVTRRIYELEIAGVDTVCDTLGRFTHSTIPWLSASPDGVVIRGPMQGRLIEIKSPKTRQPGEFVPFEYYVQMQIQMEVCDVDAVEFVEAQFAQRPIDAMTIGDHQAVANASWKGEIEVRGHLEDPTSWRYRYTEPVEDIHEAVLPDVEGLPILEHSVWWLTGWYPRTVLRNRSWWTSVGLPAAERFWKDVCEAKISYQETTSIEQSAWIGSR